VKNPFGNAFVIIRLAFLIHALPLGNEKINLAFRGKACYNTSRGSWEAPYESETAWAKEVKSE